MMKKNKTNWMDKYIQISYGVVGPIDEYKQAQINHIGSKAYFISSNLDLITLLVGTIVYNQMNITTAYFVFLTGLFISFMIGNFYFSINIQRKHLNINEVEAKDLPRAKRWAWLGSLRTTVIFLILEFGYGFLEIGKTVLQPRWLLFFGLLGIIIFVLVAFSLMHRIKVVKDDE